MSEWQKPIEGLFVLAMGILLALGILGILGCFYYLVFYFPRSI